MAERAISDPHIQPQTVTKLASGAHRLNAELYRYRAATNVISSFNPQNYQERLLLATAELANENAAHTILSGNVPEEVHKKAVERAETAKQVLIDYPQQTRLEIARKDISAKRILAFLP